MSEQSTLLVQTTIQLSPEVEIKPGDIVLVEFKDGNNKIITITDMDEEFIYGHYDYQDGAYRVSDAWERNIISSIKHAHRTIVYEPVQPKLENVFKSGDYIALEFKNGELKEIELTHMNDRVIAGHYEYSYGRTTPVNYDRRDIKSIRYAKKDPNKKNYNVDF